MVRTFMHNEDDKEASVDVPLGSRSARSPSPLPGGIPLGKDTLGQGEARRRGEP